MIGAHIESVLIITGAVTAVALIQFATPSQVLRLIYGHASTDAASLMLARHWGLLIGGTGLLLIYAAFEPPLRVPIMVFAVVEKVVLGVLILGTDLRRHLIAAAIAVGDLLIALVYLCYLAGFWD